MSETKLELYKKVAKRDMELTDLRQQMAELGKAIVECAVVAGIVDGKMSLTGPQIILLAEDIKSLILSTRQQLAEKDKEIQERHINACLVAKELRDTIRKQSEEWQETAKQLLERAENAEAENADLRKKGKGIEVK